MGIFDKKTCVICGQKQRILGYKLADGNYLCSDCYSKCYYNESFAFQDNNKKEAKYHKHIQNLTLEQYRSLVQLREENLEELRNFNATKSFCGIVHFDVEKGTAIFVDKVILADKKRLYKENPPVFRMSNLAFARVSTSEIKESKTLTGKPRAECKILLTLGFEDPLYDIIHMEVGKIVSKPGMFGIKTSAPKDLEEMMQTIEALVNWEVAWSEEYDVDIPASSMDTYWRLAKRAKDYGYLTSSDINTCLKNYYGRDRKLMREVKKQYGL